MNKKLYDKIMEVFKETDSLCLAMLNTGQGEDVVKKVLITEGYWNSPRSQTVSVLRNLGMTNPEIAQKLKLKVREVMDSLPYNKELLPEDDEEEVLGQNYILTDDESVPEYLKSDKERQRSFMEKKISENKAIAENPESVKSDIVDETADIKPETKISKKPVRRTAKRSLKNPFIYTGKPEVFQLHMELKGSNIAELNKSNDEADQLISRSLQKYGDVKKSISRDVLVPASLTLHQLNYLIQQAFGWKNSHLHLFELPKKVFDQLTDGKFIENRSLWGQYFRFPNYRVDDLYWDEDEDESGKTFSAWLKSKYRNSFVYDGISEYWGENQVAIETKLENDPMLSLLGGKAGKYESLEINLKEATSAQVLNNLCNFEGGVFEQLNESIPLGYLLTKNPVDLKKVKEKACSYWSSKMDEILDQYRKQGFGIPYGYVFDTEYLIEKHLKDYLSFQPEALQPITDKIIYEYDFGDGWNVEITLTKVFDQDTENEKAQKVFKNGNPICLACDGLDVVDDIGNVRGYAEFLMDYFEGTNPDTAVWVETYEWNDIMTRPEMKV